MDNNPFKTSLYMNAVQYGIAGIFEVRSGESYELARALFIFAKRSM